jgi:para-nitrobenzyl esterase
MKTVLCCLLASILACGTDAVAKDRVERTDQGLVADLIVDTDKGQVEGRLSLFTGTPLFLGIPYAAPPVGALRWKPPAPVKAWNGVRDAFEFGQRCPQVDDSVWSKPSPYSEDCLYLNVWTPRSGSNHPVMFYIHGGGFLVGAARDMGVGPLLNGAHLAANHNVVVVTIDYRLGALGFLTHPSLAAESPQGISGNYGLLDMIAALKWVQANIANFGGDPKKVMIFGHSAGGTATCALLVSPLAKGLFSSAAIQSGWCGAATMDDRLDAGRKVAERLHCPGADAATAACLRSLKPDDLLKEVGAFNRNYYIFAPWKTSHNLTAGPTVDNHVLPEAPLAMLRKGSHNHVPLIIGSTEDEFEFFIANKDRIRTCKDHEEYITKQFEEKAADVLRQYPCTKNSRARRASVQAGGDFYFTCPLRRAVMAAAASQTEPVYEYLFAYPAKTLYSDNASHLVDIPYVFGTLLEAITSPFDPEHRELSGHIQQYWTDFANNGNPNPSGHVKWTGSSKHETWSKYDKSQGNYLVLDATITEDVDLKDGRCNFWDTLDAPF